MSSHRLETISVTNLCLDEENPRLDSTVNRRGQIEVIRDIMRDPTTAGHVYTLALDILEFGIDPTSLVCVIPREDTAGRYTVLEGNRRVTALKIINNPELISGVVKTPLENNFKILNLESKSAPINEIVCLVFEDAFQIQHWIELRHTGQNGGAGLVEWNSVAQERYNAKSGNTSPELQALDFVRKYSQLDSGTKNIKKKFPITSLQRLLKTPEIRKRIGLELVDNNLLSGLPAEAVLRVLQKIVTDLSSKGFSVREIINKDLRMEYIENLGEEILPDLSTIRDPKVLLSEMILPNKLPIKTSTENSLDRGSLESKTNTDSKNGSSSNEASSDKPSNQPAPSSLDAKSGGQKTITLPSVKRRKSIIPADYQRRIEHIRINEIFLELQRLNVNEAPNAGAVLLRVFIELSVDYFIDLNKIAVNSDPKKNYLAQKIEKVIKYLTDNGTRRKDLASVRSFTSQNNSIGSTRTMNDYVHNPSMHPEPETLKLTWHNLIPLVEKIWP